MKTATHTPGPWQAINDWEIRARDFGSINIADIRWNGHNEKHGRANARLIAAAPELLESLEAALARIECEWPDGRDGRGASPRTPGLIRDCKAQVHAAIAKARGEG